MLFTDICSVVVYLMLSLHRCTEARSHCIWCNEWRWNVPLYFCVTLYGDLLMPKSVPRYIRCTYFLAFRGAFIPQAAGQLLECWVPAVRILHKRLAYLLKPLCSTNSERKVDWAAGFISRWRRLLVLICWTRLKLFFIFSSTLLMS